MITLTGLISATKKKWSRGPEGLNDEEEGEEALKDDRS